MRLRRAWKDELPQYNAQPHVLREGEDIFGNVENENLSKQPLFRQR